MKHAITGQNIIPLIHLMQQGISQIWIPICEKVFVHGRWIKMNYYSVILSIDDFPGSTLTDMVGSTINLSQDVIIA